MKKSLITLAAVATLVAAGAQSVNADVTSKVDAIKGIVPDTRSEAAKKYEAYTKSVTYLATAEAKLNAAKGAVTTAKDAVKKANEDKAKAVALTDAEKEAEKNAADAVEAAKKDVAKLEEAIADAKANIAKLKAQRDAYATATEVADKAKQQADIDALDAQVVAAENQLKLAETDGMNSLKEAVALKEEALVTVKEANAERVAATTKSWDKAIAKLEAAVAKSETEANEWTAVVNQLKGEMDAAKVSSIKAGLTETQMQLIINEALQQVEAEVKTVSVTRLRNKSNYHYFTTEAAKVASLKAEGWVVEGEAFKAPVTGTAVYTVTNPNTGYNHFTANAEEIAKLEKLGWVKGEIAFYAAAEGTSVTRLYNPNAGYHVFSSNAEEIAGLVALGWNNEGHAYYVAK